MKSYNIKNYIRYRKDLEKQIKKIELKELNEYTRDQLIIKFLPLVENLARKFSTAQQASGVMDITDIIQEGSKGLIQAVNKIDWDTMSKSEDKDKTIKSFLSKRIKGAIRRGIDINRGTMRIPEHRINEMRKNNDSDRKAVEEFFNSVFISLDTLVDNSNNAYDVPDNIKNYNPDLLSSYIMSLLWVYLSEKEAEVIILSYGLNCDRMPAKDIAEKLDIKGDSAYVRISQIKRQAIDKLIENVNYSQVVDFL